MVYNGVRCFLPFLALTFFLIFPGSAPGEWKRIDHGLELGAFLSPQAAERGDSMVRVLRINPRYYGLKLINASADKSTPAMSAREWCLKYNLQAAINASMYQKDGKTSVSLMRTSGHINNPRLSRDKTILAFDPKVSGGPAVKIIDRQCDNFRMLKNRFRTLVQSIRMISCRGANVWEPQEERWSTAALALDSDNNILFIHVKSPYSTHDLIKILQALPLAIERAMYLEGGPEAQMFIRNNKRTWEYYGGYSGGFASTEPPGYAWPIPNIIGIYRKSPDSSKH